jgi:hypothetical protein
LIRSADCDGLPSRQLIGVDGPCRGHQGWHSALVEETGSVERRSLVRLLLFAFTLEPYPLLANFPSGALFAEVVKA